MNPCSALPCEFMVFEYETCDVGNPGPRYTLFINSTCLHRIVKKPRKSQQVVDNHLDKGDLLNVQRCFRPRIILEPQPYLNAPFISMICAKSQYDLNRKKWRCSDDGFDKNTSEVA